MSSNLPNLSLSLLLLIGVSGCANKPGVPRDAILVTERSAGLAFAASESGTVYITSKNARKLVYSTEVHRGDKLIFYPESKRIILNGTVVKEDSSFDPKQVHRLYFLKG